MRDVIAKYGLGDRVEVVKETRGHPFALRTKLTIVGLPNQVNSDIYDSYYFCKPDDDGTSWWIKDECIQPLIEKIPEYFMVKNDTSSEFSEYITWLNNKFSCAYSGDTYAYYGIIKNGEGSLVWGTNSEKNFEGDPKVFSAKEFMNLVKNQSMKRTIKREDFKRIITRIPKTCTWYKELLLIFSDFTIKDELEVPEGVYLRGRKAADIPMNELLDEIFGKDKPKISNYDIVKNIAFNNLTNGMILPYAEELYYYVVIDQISGGQELKAEHKTRNDIYV